jgi:dienelactone hydrolase
VVFGIRLANKSAFHNPPEASQRNPKPWRFIMKRFTFVLSIVLLIVVVPVIFAQVGSAEERQLRYASLAGATYEEINFHNKAQNIEIGGMLFQPQGEGPFPAAVIVHGAGTSRRDNGWYVMLARDLQDNGIIVLLPDKRGSEKSGGDWRTSSFEDLATDTVAALEYLKGREDLAIGRMGIVGSSQGGHIAPLIAAQTDDIDFVVNMVGAAVPIHEELLYEENQNLRQMGLLPGISNLVTYPSAWSITQVRQKDFWDAVGDYDPLPYWRKLQVPALVLYGADDTNVPSARSAALLKSLGMENIDVRVYEGSGHSLEEPAGQGSRAIREDVICAVVEFIH